MKKVLYTSPHIPTEWIRAHGLTPVRIVPNGNETGVFDLSEGICGYSKAFFNAIDDKDVVAVIVAGVCDQMRRGVDFIEQESTFPLYLIHIPTTWKQNNAAHIYQYEIKRLGEFLCTVGGKSPTDMELKEAILFDQEKRSRCEISFDTLPYRSYRRELQHYFESTESQLNSEEKFPDSKRQVALLGGPIPQSHLDLTDMLESNGIRIVVDGSETGFRSWPSAIEPRSLNEFPFEALCDNWSDSIRSVFQRPNTQMYQWLKREIGQWDVDGILYIRWVWCDLWHGEFERIAQWLDIPVIPIDITGTDSTERNRTRVEAFCESLI